MKNSLSQQKKKKRNEGEKHKLSYSPVLCAFCVSLPLSLFSSFLFPFLSSPLPTPLLDEVVVLVRQRRRGGLGQLRLVRRLLREVDRDLGRRERDLLDKVQLRVAHELAREVEEGLLVVVVGLGRDLVVLQVLLPVEGHLLGLDLAVLDVDLVAAEDDRDVFADAAEVAVPGGDVLVGEARGDVEHDDGALAVDVVAVAEAAWCGRGGEGKGEEEEEEREKK